MMLSSETWLALGIYGFYLFDCLKLTEANRVYFTLVNSSWGYRLPRQALHIGHQALDIFNPFMFWQLQLPSTLILKRTKVKQKFDKRFNKAIQGIVPIQIIFSVCMLILLPVALLFDGLGQFFLLFFVTAYLCIGIALFKVYRIRKILHLSNSQCASLAIECVLCSPFAINLIRKIGLLQIVIPDSAAFAHKHLSPETLIMWKLQMVSHALEQQQWYEADEPMYQEWKIIAKRIQGGKS